MFVTGKIEKRLNVQGNEDAYKAKKKTTTLVEQESKKNWYESFLVYGK